MASIKKTGENAYQIVVSCGYNSIGKKIRRKITYKPELLTAKGNPKSAASIEKDVAAFAADFERKVLTGQYTDGHIMTFEKYAAKYLAEYAEENQAPRTLQSTESAIKEFISAFGYMTLENLTPLYLQEYVNALLKRKKADGSGETRYRQTQGCRSVCHALAGYPLESSIREPDGARTDKSTRHTGG